MSTNLNFVTQHRLDTRNMWLATTGACVPQVVRTTCVWRDARCRSLGMSMGKWAAPPLLESCLAEVAPIHEARIWPNRNSRHTSPSTNAYDDTDFSLNERDISASGGSNQSLVVYFLNCTWIFPPPTLHKGKVRAFDSTALPSCVHASCSSWPSTAS